MTAAQTKLRSRAWGVAICSLLTGSLLQSVALADFAGVTPYATLNLEPEIERDLERIMILADQPVMSRPIALGRVVDALPKACRNDHRLCQRVRSYIRHVDRGLLANASAELATTSGSSRPVANGHGMSIGSSWKFSFDGGWQPSAYFRAGFGAVLDATRSTPTGTLLSAGFSSAQLDVGYRDHWLSPLIDSAMVLSTEAPTLPSITVSNWLPLTRLGIHYEVFVAELSSSRNISFGSGYTYGAPTVTGLHFAIAPAQGWSLAVNRMLQSGGGARGGSSMKQIFCALINPHRCDNGSASLSKDQEAGNQVASLTSRMLFQGRTPFAVSFEYAGEDTSHGNNYLLGNSALSAGIDFPQLWKDFDFSFEMTDWQNGWYVHSIYQDGLTNYGNVIGHWFGDQRLRNDGVGGQSRMARLRWQLASGRVAQVQYRTLTNAAYSSVNYERARELTLDYSMPWRSWRVGGQLLAGIDVYGKNFMRLSAVARLGDESVHSLAGIDDSSDDAAPESNSKYERFVDLGISKWHESYESSDRAPISTITVRKSPHLGLGARRTVSARQDLGARIEREQVNGASLLAVRALDYRYRWSSHVALTAYAGAARFALATPAYGYFFGGGAQWRHVLRDCDLNLDFRFGDKIARDSLLPGDPPTTARPDVFYTLTGIALYVTVPF